MGVGVKTGEGFALLTGNQTGALLTDFILKFKKDIPANAAIVKTIVTSGIGAAIAAERGVQTVQTLTGFKYIGKKICDWELSGEHTFIFGYEESYGYLAGTHARDKDAVSSSMLIAEMAAYYKSQGMTLIDALNGIYAKYGYYYDCLETLVLKGKAGAEKIRAAMSALRAEGGGLFDDIDVNSNKLGATVAKRNAMLVKLLDGIGAMKLGEYKENTIDAFGDAYEYLMSMYASNAGKSGGQYFTPADVSELLARLGTIGKTRVNKVYDPACGSGSLLLKAAKILGKENVRQGFFGQEINLTTYNLCRINMFLHDIDYPPASLPLPH